MLRLLKRFSLFIIFMMYADMSLAHQTCVNVQVGSNPVFQNNVIVAYQPVYSQQCTWYYAAIAIDPNTRKYSYAYNYTDIHDAENYVSNECGSSCVWISTLDVAYVALSDDGKYGLSRKSAADAIRECGRDDCDWAIMTGTAAPAEIHIFGAIAYSSNTHQSGQSWIGVKASSVKQGALESCAAKDCWAYVYDWNYAAIAENAEGRLFAKGAKSIGEAIRDAVKYCKAEGKSDTCKVAALGQKFGEIPKKEWDGVIKNALSANMLQRLFD